MKYQDFKSKVINLPVISPNDLVSFGKNKQIISNQLKRWQDRGLIIKLKRGMYLLNESDRKIDPSKHFIANQLYTPSYVSLECALNFYGLIPERVSDITSVTTKKTVHFINPRGSFIYQHIKPNVLRGFKAVKDEEGLTFFIAEPEKAIIDFLYLNLNKIRLLDKNIFKDSYRFQNVDTLSRKKIIELAALFNNKKLMKAARLFCEFIKEEIK